MVERMMLGPLTVARGTRYAGRMTAADGGELLTIAETARRFGVSYQRVQQWIKAGLPVAPESPRDPRTGAVLRAYLRPADVVEWKAAAAVRHAARSGRPRRTEGGELPPGLEWASDPDK